MKAREVCPLCLRTGVQSYLHSYQINLDEAVILCEKKHCPYPLATENYTSVTFSRSLSDVPSSRAGEVDLGLPDGARDLQAKVASHMTKMGHRLQKDAIGIQTGSPQLKKRSCSSLLSAGHQSDTKLPPIQTGLRHPQQNGYTTLQNGSHSSQNGCHSRNGSQPTQNGSRCLQSGFQSSPTGFHTSQNCVQSSSRLQSFTNKDTGAMSGRAWSSGAGSDGNSDKDSVFNSSLDSMDSSSSTGSSRSTDDVQKPARTSQYPAFQFGQGSKRALSVSDSVKSVQVTKKSQSISPHTDGSEVKGSRVIHVIKSKNSSIVNGVDNGNKLTESIDNLSNDLSSLSTLKSVSLCSKEVVLPKHSITSQSSTLNIGQEILNQCPGDRIYMLNYPSVFPQWRNRDALCWLDVILCLVVHNLILKSLVFTSSFDKTHLICKLLTAHRQACLLMDQVVRSRNGSQTEISSPMLVLEQTSQGHQENTNIKNQMQQVSKNSSDVNTCSVEFGSRDACLELRQKMKGVLEDAREQVWEVMKAHLKCERGQNESPVFAFPLLLKEHSSVEQLFQMSYRFVYKCTGCGREERTDHVNTLPTFPMVVKDFNFTRPQHVKICAKCGSSKDPRTMVYKELPQCLLMHFTEGLSPLSWSDLEAGFSFGENIYQVTGLVQYVHNPDHFIAWLRNPRDKKWMKCDDLHQTACSYLSGNPPFSTGEIHIIMWEQQNTALHTNNHIPVTALPVAMETCSGYLESCSQASDIRHTPSKHGNLSKKYITAESSFAKTALFSNSILQEKKKDANNTSILTKNPSSKGETLLNYIQQKLEGVVTDIDSSPCSTLSTESETILLPNFVASTPVSTSLLRPVPKPISSVTNDVGSQLGTSLSETMATGKTSEMNSSENSVCQPVINKVLQKNKTKSTSEHNGACSMHDISIRDYGCSQIVGQKTLIQPSTVFCVPKKSEHEIMKVSSINQGTNDKPESENVLNSSIINPEINNLSNQMSTNDNEDDVNSEKCEISGCKKGRRKHSVINKDLINEAQCIAGRIEKAKIKIDEVVADRSSNALRFSQRTSKFKLPIAKVSSKPSSVSRDAFFTLGDESMPNVSRSSSQQSTEPTPWNGNLSNLNMVKQYLLSRTTGRPDHRLKFEGLNLKSATTTHLTSLSELDFRISSVASGTSLGCSSVNNSVSCNNTEQPLSSKSSEKIPGCRATNPSLINNTAVCSTGAGRSTTMQVSSVKPQRQRMKRKRDTDLQNNVNKWIDEGLQNLPGDQTSLKENSSCMTLRKRAPGGKKMRLVMQHARKSENSNLEHKVNDELITTRLPRTNTVTMETKCETENVLQDLYEALNIPYNAVNSTMSDIMTDVDDILDFVSVSDVLEEQRSSTPLSCPETSACGSLKHSDCWKRQPGRNSA